MSRRYFKKKKRKTFEYGTDCNMFSQQVIACYHSSRSNLSSIYISKKILHDFTNTKYLLFLQFASYYLQPDR